MVSLVIHKQASSRLTFASAGENLADKELDHNDFHATTAVRYHGTGPKASVFMPQENCLFPTAIRMTNPRLFHLIWTNHVCFLIACRVFLGPLSLGVRKVSISILIFGHDFYQGKAKRNLISGIALGLWTDRAFNWISRLIMKCGIQLSPSSNVLSEAISTSEKYWVGWRYFFDWRLHRGLVLLHQHAIRCYFIDSSFLRASG